MQSSEDCLEDLNGQLVGRDVVDGGWVVILQSQAGFINTSRGLKDSSQKLELLFFLQTFATQHLKLSHLLLHLKSFNRLRVSKMLVAAEHLTCHLSLFL